MPKYAVDDDDAIRANYQRIFGKPLVEIKTAKPVDPVVTTKANAISQLAKREGWEFSRAFARKTIGPYNISVFNRANSSFIDVNVQMQQLALLHLQPAPLDFLEVLDRVEAALLELRTLQDIYY